MANIFSNIWSTIKSIPEQWSAMGQLTGQKLSGSLFNAYQPKVDVLGEAAKTTAGQPYINPVTQQSVVGSGYVPPQQQSTAYTNPYTQQSTTYYQPSVTTGGTGGTAGSGITGHLSGGYDGSPGTAGQTGKTYNIQIQ